jgi:hypothetical protein
MWDAIGAVSSAFGTVSVVAALVFAARQVGEAKDSRAEDRGDLTDLLQQFELVGFLVEQDAGSAAKLERLVRRY